MEELDRMEQHKQYASEQAQITGELRWEPSKRFEARGC
jgi:hypothetical protein